MSKTIFLMIAFFCHAFLSPLIAETKTSPKTEKSQKVPSDQGKFDYPDVTKTTESYESAIFKTVIVLIAIIVLVILTIWMFKRLSHSRQRQLNYVKTIKVLEKRPLSPKSMLYLLDIGGKQLLIAESQIEVRALSHFDWPTKEKIQ